MALTQTPEEGLKVSNTPSNGQFLQYKDSTDKLTWATVTSGAGGSSGLDLDDDVKIQFGTDDDFFVEYNTDGSGGTSNALNLVGTDGEMYVRVDNFMLLSDDSGGRAIYMDNTTNSLELGYDGHENINCTETVTTFKKDILFDNPTNAGLDVTWDHSANSLIFNDNVFAKFGTHGDGALYSSGTGITLASLTPSAGSSGHINLNASSGNSVSMQAGTAPIASFQNDLATLYGTVDIQGPDSTNAGTLRINDTDSFPNHVSITVPDDGVTSNYTITLPAAAPASNGQVLSATTAGVASWTTISGGVESDDDTNTVAGTNAGNAGTWSGANGNTCVGYNAGTDLTSADYNTLMGEEAGANLTTGYKNVAIGNKALETSTNGFENVAIGWSALPVVPYGTQNVAIGCKALESGDDAGIRENVAVGFEALKDLTGTYGQAYGNTALGYMAGKDNDDKPENCFLGRQAGMNQNMSFGELWIAHRDHAKGTDSVWIHGASDGKCINGDNSSSWNTTSDERIKKNIVDNNVGLEKIKQLRIRNFEYKIQEETGTDSEGHTTWAPKTDSDVIDTSTFTTLSNGQKPRPDQVAINKTGVQLGCIAQEVEAVLPNSVATDVNGCKSVQTDEMFWIMVNAVKQLSDKNDALEARIATLEAA